MPNPLDLFVKNVKIALAKKQMSQADLGKKMGISPQAISLLMSGTHEPRLSKVFDVAEAVGVAPATLLEPQSAPSNLVEQLSTVGSRLDETRLKGLIAMARALLEDQEKSRSGQGVG